MSFSSSQSFTRTHAREIAAKIATDLRQMSRFYGKPDLDDIEDYLTEVTALLVAGYLHSFEDGFERSGQRVFSLRYVVRTDGTIDDSAAGRVEPGSDISGATNFNHVTYTDKFLKLSSAEQQKFKDTLPVTRTPGAERTDGPGRWVSDRGYSTGGVGVQRGMFKPL